MTSPIPGSSSQTPPCRGLHRAALSPGAQPPLGRGRCGAVGPDAGAWWPVPFDTAEEPMCGAGFEPRPASDLSQHRGMRREAEAGPQATALSVAVAPCAKPGDETPRQPSLAGNRNGLGIPRPRRKGWALPAAGCLPDAALSGAGSQPARSPACDARPASDLPLLGGALRGRDARPQNRTAGRPAAHHPDAEQRATTRWPVAEWTMRPRGAHAGSIPARPASDPSPTARAIAGAGREWPRRLPVATPPGCGSGAFSRSIP